MSNRIQRSRTRQGGFTLIELLVVVLIIGILASIAVPAYLGQKRKAQDTAAKALLRSGAVAAEAYYTDNESFTTPPMVPALLAGEEQNVVWQDPTAPGWIQADAARGEVDVEVIGNGYALSTKSRTGTIFSYARDVNGGTFKCSGTTRAATTTGCVGTYSGGW